MILISTVIIHLIYFIVGDKLIVAGKILAIIGATNQGIPLEEVSENIKIVKPEDGE